MLRFACALMVRALFTPLAVRISNTIHVKAAVLSESSATRSKLDTDSASKCPSMTPYPRMGHAAF
jgi:hypothetical protein